MREKSCMIVVPENEEDIRIEKVLARLENSNDIKMTGELKLLRGMRIWQEIVLEK